jgi:hypothetical protein
MSEFYILKPEELKKLPRRRGGKAPGKGGEMEKEGEDMNKLFIFEIRKIDWESFPVDCQPHIDDSDLPRLVFIGDKDKYRTDAGACGVLSHSPYCPYCPG